MKFPHTQRQAQRLIRRMAAETLFFGRALHSLTGPAVRALLVAITGATIEHYLGAPPNGTAPPWNEAFYRSYQLLMGETPDTLPEHFIAQAVLYIQPILGILLMAEGVLKLGFEVFNKEANAEEWMNTLASASRNHVILCGLGTVGFRTLEELIALDEQVFVIERKSDNAFLDQARALGAHVIIGDARTDNLLRGLNIIHARAVLVVTDDDLANLEIAMDIRELAPQVPIVMRLYDQRLANKVKHTIGVQVSVSTSKLAAPLLASSALDPAVVGTHRIGDRMMVVMQLKLGGELGGKTVQELSRNYQLTVLGIQERGAWSLQPRPEHPLETGSTVQVLCDSNRIAQTHQWNGEPVP